MHDFGFVATSDKVHPTAALNNAVALMVADAINNNYDKYSYAFVIMPGGFGTQDEFFETLTLAQTKVINDFPIVVMGRQFYQPFQHWMEHMIQEGTISPEDKKFVLFTDSCEEAIHHISTYVNKHYIVKPRKRLWWLFEKV
mgnify:CR=1 FL=1